MKNYYRILLVILFLVVGSFIGIMLFFSYANTETWIENSEDLYQQSVEFIKKEHLRTGYDNKEQDYQVFVDYHGFGIEEKDQKKYVYLWILEESYYVKNNKLRSSQGSSMPYKFTFKDDNILSYETPKDGSLYAPSIKKLFPDRIENQVLSFTMEDTTLKSQVIAHYSYLNSTEIFPIDPEEDIILFTGYYGGYTEKSEANSIKGKCIDFYGNVYEYKIPCNEKEEMLIPVKDITKEVVEKYKGNVVSTLKKEEVDILLRNQNRITDECKTIGIQAEDSPYSFVYLLSNGKQKALLEYASTHSRENVSKSGKEILDLLVKNQILYLMD